MRDHPCAAHSADAPRGLECSDIEDRALEEGVAAAMIAQGSAKLDSTICEYLDDEGSHEAVGMEGGGVLDAIDKPLVPVLIEMIR